MCELASVCRDDLVALPKETAKEMGGIGPLVLVYKISKFVHIVDINTMQTYEIDNAMYWKNSFSPLLTREMLTEFIVLEIEDMDTNMNDSRAALKQRFRQVKVQVARKSDFGNNETTFWVNCHLGEILSYNDSVLGYDME
jgi:nonsense-mediated mRNA decay protein 3